ncbi:MAG: NTP transferase domain-containing protein, partial [Deltaproteobacteria bacterium]|nr:NTP transferase domain-containing protein [Deltaproteobacteria bacterium]
MDSGSFLIKKMSGTKVSDTNATLALLVGGHSERMGRDKGLLPARGNPLVLHQILRLKPLFQDILIVCSSLEQKKQYEKILNFPIVIDESGQDRAAYYGLICALKNSSTEKVVVLPVDAIAVDIPLLKKLLSAQSFPAAYEEYPFPSV